MEEFNANNYTYAYIITTQYRGSYGQALRRNAEGTGGSLWEEVTMEQADIIRTRPTLIAMIRLLEEERLNSKR